MKLYRCCHPVPVVPYRSSDFACRFELAASRTREGGRVGISHVYPPKILCAFWVASVVLGRLRGTNIYPERPSKDLAFADSMYSYVRILARKLIEMVATMFQIFEG